MVSTISSFQNAISQPRNRGLGSITVLAWVASCDGSISAAKHKLLRQFADSQKDDGILELALQVAMSPRLEDLKAACEVVQEMPVKGQQTVLTWAFSVATADNRLGIASNYVLRFLADLTETDFSVACRTASKKIPLPGDVSSVEWWNWREGKTGKSSEKTSREEAKKPFVPQHTGMTLDEARGVLQLGHDPTESEITKAFRRMATLHHPDRHSQAGAEAQRSAAKKFAVVRRAFELLSEQ